MKKISTDPLLDLLLDWLSALSCLSCFLSIVAMAGAFLTLFYYLIEWIWSH